MNQQQRNSKFVKDVQKIIEELDNANVVKHSQNKLSIWTKIFKRFLQPDGQMVLYQHDAMRASTKKKIEDAFECGKGHPVIYSAEALTLIIDNIEIGFFNPDDISVVCDAEQV